MRSNMIFLVKVVVLALLISKPYHVYCSANETIRVGVSLSLSSEDNSEWGRRTLAGVKIRAEEWNRSGKTPRVELIVRDDFMDEAAAIRNVRDLVENEAVTAIIGPSSSKLALALREYCRAHKVITISPNATHPEIGIENEWVFRMMFDDTFQAKALASFAYDNLNMRRAGVFINTFIPYPESVFQTFSEHLTRIGGEVVHVERYEWCDDNTSVYDFGDALNAMFSKRPEIILLPLYSPDAISILQQSLGFDVNSTFCGTDTWDSKLLFEGGGSRLHNSFFTSGLNLQSHSPEMQHFQELYHMSNEAYAEPSSVLGYDALSLILFAYESTDDPDVARSRLISLRNYPLASGPITIDPKYGTFRPVHIFRIVHRDGNFDPVHEDTFYPDHMNE